MRIRIHADLFIVAGSKNRREGIIVHVNLILENLKSFTLRSRGNQKEPQLSQPCNLRMDLGKPRGRVILVNVTVFLLWGNIGILGESFIYEAKSVGMQNKK